MSDVPDSDQKTEAATPKRRADAARDGDILQSREFATALVTAAGVAWLIVAGGGLFSASRVMLAEALALDAGAHRNFDPLASIMAMGNHIAIPLAGLLAVTFAGAIAGPALLGSAGFRSKAMAFKPGRINPLSGLKRIFGLQGLIELAKAIAKTVLLGAIGWWLITANLPAIMSLGRSGLEASTATIGGLLATSLGWLAFGLCGIAAFDVPMQIFQRNAKLRMTKQEVRDEHKQTEGSPERKQAQRQRQYAILSGSARTAVAEATVVLTNPSHFAVALRYVPGKDAAPVVVARGQGEIALAIRALSVDANVPLLEYPLLARAIYFTSRTGRTVSEELYVAVATVLAFVLNLDRAMGETLRNPPVSVPPAFCFDEFGKPITP